MLLHADKQEALEIICERSSQGRIVTFLNDEETDLQAGITISVKRKTIYVIFRGSESGLDWWYDFQVGKESIDGLNNDVKIHRGFYSQLFDNFAYENLRDSLKILLAHDEYKDFDIYVSGHSLGKGIGEIFSYFLADEIKNKITLVTFGGPRVGNDNYAKSFHLKDNLTHYRVTNERDFVTVTPFYNYYQTGINIRLCSDNIEIYEELPSKEFNIFSCWDPREHYCDCYFDRLKKLSW